VRKAGNKQWIFVLNHGASSQSVNLPAAFVDLLTGEKLTGKIDIGAYGVRVLQAWRGLCELPCVAAGDPPALFSNTATPVLHAVTRAGSPAATIQQLQGWQLWYVFPELDCLRYVAVLQTWHAQVDARSSQAPEKECGSR